MLLRRSPLQPDRPDYGPYLNAKKCEPSDDNSFPKFPCEVLKPSKGIHLLGSPLWCTQALFHQSAESSVSKIQSLQSNILNPQVELHLLRSCLGVCKLNHLLHTIPNNLIPNELSTFDQRLRSSLTDILNCPVNTTFWK